MIYSSSSHRFAIEYYYLGSSANEPIPFVTGEKYAPCHGISEYCRDLTYEWDYTSSAINTPLSSVYQSELKTAIYWRLNDPVRQLVAEGADINEKDQQGETPLYIAAWNGNLQAVEILIKAGAEVNIRDIYGDTPLMAAVDQGNVRIVKELIVAGADVTIKNNDGSTPLHYAGSSYNGAEIARILINAGVDVNAINSFGRSAMNYAILNNANETAEVIRDHGGQNVSMHNDTHCKAIHLNKELASTQWRFTQTKEDCAKKDK